MRIDYERLRRDLQDVIGPAAFVGLPFALGDVAALDGAGPEELLDIARREGIDLRRYADGSTPSAPYFDMGR